MPRYLTPRKSGRASIAICGRCKFKFHHDELIQDRNVPGLWVCTECCDDKDPYKLPGLKPDVINIPHPRPDEPLE